MNEKPTLAERIKAKLKIPAPIILTGTKPDKKIKDQESSQSKNKKSV